MLKAGSILTCPDQDCQAPQIRSTKDLTPGQQMNEAIWESMGFDMDGQRAGCYKCGTKFVREHPLTKRTQMHTEENGWFSLSKENPADAKI